MHLSCHVQTVKRAEAVRQPGVRAKFSICHNNTQNKTGHNAWSYEIGLLYSVRCGRKYY